MQESQVGSVPAALPNSFRHWIAQSEHARKLNEETIFKIERLLPDDPVPLTIAFTSKQSAQRLLAALAEQQEKGRYRVSCFKHPTLPGLER